MNDREDVRSATARRTRRLALVTVCLIMFLTFMDMTIVSVALGSVQAKLHAGVTQLQWVVNGYGLTFAGFMLLGGTLGDRLGRKRVMLLGLGLFAAGSLVGALAPNPDVLIAARVIMGVGAAASEPGTLSVLRQMYPEGRERARAIGTWAAVSGFALAFGPVIGGVLVAADDWPGVFWFNVAASVAVIALAIFSVPESSSPAEGRLDVGGFLTGALGLSALTFAVILGETDGYRSSWVIALFLIGVVALSVFVHVERRGEGSQRIQRHRCSVESRNMSARENPPTIRPQNLDTSRENPRIIVRSMFGSIPPKPLSCTEKEQEIIGFGDVGGPPGSRSQHLESVSRTSTNVHQRPDLLAGRSGVSTNVH